LALAAEALGRGELIVYPTDTLYALGCRARDPVAVERLRGAKGREDQKPLPLVAEDAAQAKLLCSKWPEAADRLAEAFWPGPLTLVLPAAEGVPVGVTAGSGTVAVRVPALLLARELCRASGPLVATSANLAGAPAPLTCAEAVSGLGDLVRLALDAGPGSPVPSTLVALTEGGARLLREGAVPWAKVAAFLGALRP